MTPRQITLVQSTWSKIAAHSAHLAETFYDRLFQLDPSLRPMFSPDMNEQRRALMEMLHIVVNGLFCFEELLPDIEALGRRHVSYHVVESQYDLVRKALLRMLAEELGDEFTSEVEAAWAATYDRLADVMKGAAYAHV
jgi:hemoglobin-like flavoprotein